ncbi:MULTISPECIES: hypothetical protein [unclassified Haloferax]|uniref:hypothetical protein n=1 Tax=unclassified Haloferax TaxID=2625095 RepID=UPI000E269638|nr:MULTISPECIES: hypothetical protein [unclassified Haloferax]MBC9987634.1 hypothetical protein [Haloferax sp. AS1]RDZ33658.1 hypothetical protein C5B88_17840 [Haloferax sp. Atlit-24N]RLM34182.1 hypothetical protein DVK03_16620 [Haloferax sp. Atlit-109R]RLM41004.1 hypothetical protein DVK04_16435 [Haloferax sp. Atlit-105R]
MTLVEDATLGVHILAGFAALFAGFGAIVTTKGGRRHRRAGRIYVAGMTVVAVTSLALFALAPTRGRTFLALVAVFSYYFVFSGDRVLSRKRPTDGPEPLDWVAVGLLTAAGVGLLAMGALRFLAGDGFAAVMLVFGAAGTGFGVRDLVTFRRERAASREWFFEHIGRMGGGYIATVTAFSSVNFDFLPTVAAWLWPTVVGTPLIVAAIRKYRRGPSSGAAPTAD